uniref:Uncharacterized protein n=1 Tax=Anguilla anguilla TaxID=7936 RepID=A0A0E9PYC5_ANGAN
MFVQSTRERLINMRPVTLRHCRCVWNVPDTLVVLKCKICVNAVLSYSQHCNGCQKVVVVVYIS